MNEKDKLLHDIHLLLIDDVAIHQMFKYSDELDLIRGQ